MEQWITVNGMHILINRNNETRDEAINRAIAQKNAEIKERQIQQNQKIADELNNKAM